MIDRLVGTRGANTGGQRRRSGGVVERQVRSHGSGKTTVLRLILGREEPSGGEIEVAADLRIGYFSQFSELSGEASIESVLRKVFDPIRRIEADLADVTRALGELLVFEGNGRRDSAWRTVTDQELNTFQ